MPSSVGVIADPRAGRRQPGRADADGVRRESAGPTIRAIPYQIGGGDGDVGTSRTYDTLNRITRETHRDGAFRDCLYAGNTVTVRDEEHTAQTPRETVYTFQAFGSPDDARLVQLRDALNNLWTYSYTAAGDITQLAGPGGITRTWNYAHPNKLLASETHPESGTVTYSISRACWRSRSTPTARSSPTPGMPTIA